MRELLSTASLRISAAGRFDTSRMLRTGPWQAIPAPGITSRSCRVNSKQGTMPISAAPPAIWSAQAEGMRKSRSKSASLRSVEHAPHQGVVLRKLTAQTRSLLVVVGCNPQCNKPPAGTRTRRKTQICVGRRHTIQ